MDVDAYIAAHRASWDRLDALGAHAPSERRRVRELVDLYQRVATHLSVVQSRAPDPALVGRLSSLVARARTKVTGVSPSGWSSVSRFLGVDFPVAVWRARWWVIGAGLGFCLVGLVIGWWVAVTPDVQASIASPEQIRSLVQEDFGATTPPRPPRPSPSGCGRTTPGWLPCASPSAVSTGCRFCTCCGPTPSTSAWPAASWRPTGAWTCSSGSSSRTECSNSLACSSRPASECGWAGPSSIQVL